MPALAAVVVVDGHDEGYQEERAPTWHARDVAVERARRAGVPCTIISPCPDLAMTAAVPSVELPSREEERAGWPVLDVVDRRADDPRTGLFSARFAAALRRADRVVCVLNRKGRARLLACAACGELARCEQCASAVAQTDDGLSCSACGTVRPALCLACGATRMKALRIGVTRVRDELEALAGRPVGEVTAETDYLPNAAVLVGTEAVLHRAGTADLVAFLDFDQELLAPRYRAAEQALALLARAGRLVGGRRDGARVLVQTRLPKHEVLDAALHADPGRLHAAEAARRQVLRFPPFAALALVSGPAAPDLIERTEGIEVAGPDEGRWLLRAPTSKALADALAAAGRPPGRLRIEVDPLRL
jgi:primosomal protein N' (replication factor Y)